MSAYEIDAHIPPTHDTQHILIGGDASGRQCVIVAPVRPLLEARLRRAECIYRLIEAQQRWRWPRKRWPLVRPLEPIALATAASKRGVDVERWPPPTKTCVATVRAARPAVLGPHLPHLAALVGEHRVALGGTEAVATLFQRGSNMGSLAVRDAIIESSIVGHLRRGMPCIRGS